MNDRGSKPTPTDESNTLLDEHILGMLRRGTKRVVVGGEVVDVDLSAADLEVCRKRLKDIGPPNTEDPLAKLRAFIAGETFEGEASDQRSGLEGAES